MKKYYQAALALTAALSLIALLFYRHEYNKLRFVLQVFNYFGTPTKNATDVCNFSSLARKFHGDFSEPSAAWRRLSDDLYVFSAYRVDDEVRAVAFGSNRNLKEYSCAVLANPEGPEKIPGDLAFEITSEDDEVDVAYVDGVKLYGLLLVCKNFRLQRGRRIFAVEFSDGRQKNPRNVAVKVREVPGNSNHSTSAVCVAPNFDLPVKAIDAVGFVAFHESIGLRNFVVYDEGLADSLNFGLKSLASLLNFTYTTVPWNFPFAGADPRLVRHIIETDCLYRTFGRANLAVTLAWNEYVNLKYHSSVFNVVADFNKITGRSGDPFRIETLVLCVDETGGGSLNFSTPMVLSTTRRLKADGSRDVNIYELQSRDRAFSKRNYRNKLDDLVVVYRYRTCGGDQEVVDNQILRFASSMPSTQIFQFYVTGRLFSD